MFSVTVALRLALPSKPVTVNGYVPGLEPAAAVTVRMDVPPVVIVLGLNTAVAPAGRPVTLRFIVPAAPTGAFGVTVYVTLPPAMTERDGGAAVTEKSFTTTVTGAVWLTAPLVATITAWYAPELAPELAVNVTVEEPPFVNVAGANAAETPAGRPLIPRLTLPENPLNCETITP